MGDRCRMRLLVFLFRVLFAMASRLVGIRRGTIATAFADGCGSLRLTCNVSYRLGPHVSGPVRCTLFNLFCHEQTDRASTSLLTRGQGHPEEGSTHIYGMQHQQLESPKYRPRAPRTLSTLSSQQARRLYYTPVKIFETEVHHIAR